MIARVVVLVLACVLVAGCGSANITRPAGFGVTPSLPRLDAIVGHPLVIPVEIRGGVDGRTPLPATLEDGRGVEASLYWISAAPEADRAAGWLPPPGRWTATPASADARPPGVGAWFIIANLPSDAYGQNLMLGSSRFTLSWRPDPAAVATPAVRRRAPEPLMPMTVELQRVIEAEGASPVRRWRHRLITGSLWTLDDSALDSHVFVDPVIEAYARMLEAQWRAALHRLRGADAELARELESRLTCVTAINGMPAPAWPWNQADLDSLRLDLLSPRVSSARLVERTRAWLDGQPSATTWVVDDAAPTDSGGARHRVVVGAANLTLKPTLASVFLEQDPGPADLVPLRPRYAAELDCEAVDALSRLPGPVRWTVRARVGAIEQSHRVHGPHLRAEPPGVVLAPFVHDLTMKSWLSGESGGGESLPPTAAIVHRKGFVDDQSSDGDGWAVFVEGSLDAPLRDGEIESFRVWFGPRGGARAVLFITSAADVLDETPGGPLDPPPSVRVIREDGRWACLIDVPDGAIEERGGLFIAMERVDRLGVRSTWPRAMLPWQREPGRAAIDLTRWGGLSARPVSRPGS